MAGIVNKVLDATMKHKVAADSSAQERTYGQQHKNIHPKYILPGDNK